MPDTPGFLDSLMSGAGASIGGDLLGILSSWATGGFKGRPQWRDLEFMNDAQNRLWPDEIKRQGDFLSGLAPAEGKRMDTLAPHQASAYNTIQDATYSQDTQRQADRIKTMSSELGMSPWEITGTGGSNPLPSMPMQPGGGQQGQSSMPQFLQAVVPLQLAKMQNNTALKIARMQNDTTREVAGVTPRKGSQQEAQLAATKASEMLTHNQSAATQMQTRLTANTIFQNNVRTALDALPTTSTTTGPVTMTGKTGIYPLLQQLKNAPGLAEGDMKLFGEMLDKMVTSRAAQLKSELDALAKVGGQMAESFGQTISRFLPNMNQ